MYSMTQWGQKKIEVAFDGFQLYFCEVAVTEDVLRDHSNITTAKRWVGGVRKWQFLMIYNTVNHQRRGWVGLKKSKTG